MTALAKALASLKTAKSVKATHANREGRPGYHRSLKEQVVQVLSTGTLGNTFYASGSELAAEAVEVILQARNECPLFLARALVWARENGLMKTLPVLGLALLSGGGARTKKHFLAAFPRVVQTPDDLRSFVECVKSGAIPGRKGLGGVTVAPVAEFLANISEYHAMKYGSENSKGMTLADIIRMSHPKPQTAEAEERLGWLIGKRKARYECNPQIDALEILKRTDAEAGMVSLVRYGRLPYEVVLPSVRKMTPAVWEALFYHAPYMNLLRNLEAFTRHGVFEKDENVRSAAARLADPKAVEHSKVLPFRFWNAWRVYSQNEQCDSRIADALRDALELSFANMPSFGDLTVAIGSDVSGSMDDTFGDGSTRFIDIAGIFTGALLRKCEGRAIPLPFQNRIIHGHGLSSRDGILATAEKIASLGGGGTAVGAPIESLLNRKIKTDVFIGITDNEDWAYGEGHSCSGSFLSVWRRYRKEIAPEAKAFLVTIAPYRDSVAPAGEPGVRFIYGWSASVLNYISSSLEDGESQIQAIERMQL